MFHDFRRDFQYAVRMLARTPAMTFVIFLTLALGIGANAVIFTAVDAVLLRTAPVADTRSLVSVYTTSADGRDRFSTSSYPDYVDLRDSGAFAGLAAYAGIALVLDVSGQTRTDQRRNGYRQLLRPAGCAHSSRSIVFGPGRSRGRTSPCRRDFGQALADAIQR